MPITLAQLQSTISGALSGTNFQLLISSLNSTDCNTIASAFLPSATLTLTGATVELTSTGATVTVSGNGTGTGYPFNSVSNIQVVFYLDASDNAQFNLTALAASGWTLAAAFPAFVNSALASLTYSDTPQLTLSTDPAVTSPPLGMAFSGTADIATFSSGLSQMLGITTVALNGPIVMSSQGTKIRSMDLRGTTDATVDLQITTLSNIGLEIGFRKGLNPVNGQTLAYAFMRFSGDISFTASGIVYAIPVSLELSNSGGPYRLAAEISGLIQATVTELALLLNGSNISSSLPPGFQLDSIIQLTDVFIVLDPSVSDYVTMIGIEIRNRTPWTLLTIGDSGQKLTADHVNFSYTLLNPFGISNSTVSLGAEITLDKVGTIGILGWAGSGWVIQGGIPDEQTYSLSGLVNLFLGAPSGVPDMEVTEFNFLLSPTEYELSLSTVLFWKLGALPISVDEVALNLRHTTGGETVAFISGTFSIADVKLVIAADYPGDDGAWIFSGGTAPGTSIPIGLLLYELQGAFGVDLSYPDPLKSFEITELGITFNTATYDFTFHCKGDFTVSDTPVVITVDIKVVQQSDGTYRKTFAGKVVLAEKEFDLIFDTNTTNTWFIAEYYNLDGGDVNVKDLVASVTSASLPIPDTMTIALKDALFAWSSTAGYIFALDWGFGVNLTNLPLVGQYFSPDETLNLAFQVVYTSSGNFTAAIVTDLNGLLPPNTILLPVPAQGTSITTGLSLATQVRLGESPSNIALPVTINNTTGGLNAPQDSNWNNGQPQWYNVQKTFGPVYFNRVGVLYGNDSNLYFYLDATLSVAGLTLTLDGLNISAPANKFWDVSFGLNGMGVQFESGPLKIGGAFLHSVQKIKDKDYDVYSGAAMIEMESVGVTAMGSYMDYEGAPSLFVYGILDLPLGGPPFFFVTGLAAGFGYNRSLIVPTLDQMLNFPLVAEAIDVSNDQQPMTLAQMLTSLSTWIPPQVGEYWLAAGIKFTSFKIIDSFALLTIAFGEKFQLNVFGLATVLAPPLADADPLAELQLAILATFDWDSGYLGATGQLTKNSFLFSRSAKLTGGFAVCTWFKGENAGDFVITVGGYNPLYKVPAHYPRVPRLGLNWQVDSNLLLKGEFYFALTPGAIMAGGLLQATWTSGSFAAWFSAHADFLVAWKPYSYSAQLGVSIGASYTFSIFGYQKKITANIGAELDIWGPDFSGIATIDLVVVSFDVQFGSTTNNIVQPSTWTDFSNSFLPAAPLTITPAAGIVGQVVSGEETIPIVNPSTLLINVASAIPMQGIQANGSTIGGAATFAGLGIAPMGVADSNLSIQLTITPTFTAGSGSPVPITLTNEFTFTLLSQNFPAALWGESLEPGINGEAFVDSVPYGFTLTTPPLTPAYAFPIMENELTANTSNALEYNFNADEDETFVTGETNRTTINDTITNSTVVTQRNLLLGAMDVTAPINLTDLTGNMYIDAPEVLS